MIRLIQFLVFLITGASSLQAQEIPADSVLANEGWQLLRFENKADNIYASEGENIIRVETKDSVSVLYRDVSVDLTKTPALKWSWRVDQPIVATDLSVKGKDDRALAIYVSFPFDRDRAGFWESFIRSFVELVKGKDAPGRVLNYVWGGDYPAGHVLESPYLKSAGGMIILKSANSATGQWFEETIDIAADYERIFGIAPNQPYQVAISADSDDTKGHGIGYIKNIRFE